MSARSAAQSEGSRDPENGASGYQVSTCEPRGRTQRSHHAHYEPIERILVCQQTKFNQYSPAYPVVFAISSSSISFQSTFYRLICMSQQLKQLQLHFFTITLTSTHFLSVAVDYHQIQQLIGPIPNYRCSIITKSTNNSDFIKISFIKALNTFL